MSKLEQVVLVEECARAMVPLGPASDTVSVKMVGNTLLKWGTEEQKRRFLPAHPLGRGHVVPGVLASRTRAPTSPASRTRAALDGDEWVIDGQKIWTSFATARQLDLRAGAHRSDRAEAPRHLVPARARWTTPGIEVRPIRMLTGGSEFNEVFFDGARIPAGNVVGPVNGGWAVAMSLLGHERGEEAALNPIMFRHEYDRLVALAARVRAHRRPARSATGSRGATSGSRSCGCSACASSRSTSATATSDPRRRSPSSTGASTTRSPPNLAMEIMGPAGLVPEGHVPPRAYRTDDPGAPNSTASWEHVWMLNAASGTVYAGTSQVQRNILGESILGLPREPPSA